MTALSRVTVLSLRQPWAYVVVHLGKDIENRLWNTSMRGDFLIHASKSMTKDEYYGCLEFCRRVMGPSVLSRFPLLKALPRGGIVGAAKLVDVIDPCADCVCDRDLGLVVTPCGRDHGWHMPWQYGFKLQNIRASPVFVPCNGKLGFFQAAVEVVERLQAAAAAAAPR